MSRIVPFFKYRKTKLSAQPKLWKLNTAQNLVLQHDISYHEQTEKMSGQQASHCKQLIHSACSNWLTAMLLILEISMRQHCIELLLKQTAKNFCPELEFQYLERMVKHHKRYFLNEDCNQKLVKPQTSRNFAMQHPLNQFKSCWN